MTRGDEEAAGAMGRGRGGGARPWVPFRRLAARRRAVFFLCEGGGEEAVVVADAPLSFCTCVCVCVWCVVVCV